MREFETMVVEIILGLIISVVAVWVCFLVVIAVARPSTGTLRESMRVVPDTARLVKRLAADPSVHRGVRIRLWFLLAYLVSPIDLVPDFIPVLGYADDAIIIALVLRSVVRRVGVDTIRSNWPGTSDGLSALGRLCRLDFVTPTGDGG